MPRLIRIAVLMAGLIAAPTACAQNNAPHGASELQRQKLKALACMDGVWRGDAWMIIPSGERIEMTQTERVGPMLDGALKVVDGTGYNSAQEIVFHAFAVISYDAEKSQYTMRSYAQGRQGDFVVRPTEDGFSWTIPAGPATIRYQATIKDGRWHEVGERIVGTEVPD